ncbi:MAG: agmatinase [Vampirovibrio sp.]|nr:agmatinase [Vampirovibrio sp.]
MSDIVLPGPFHSLQWMGSTDTLEDSDIVIVGLPYDGTCSYRPGSRFAPQAIREASYGLETYSPISKKDLENIRFYDGGDLSFPFGNRDETLAIIRKNAQAVVTAGKKWVGIGGEHLVTLPAVEAYLDKYPDLAILHFDAHGDLRDDYMGEKLSHATVIRRVADRVGPERLVQIGIRSGPQEEFDWMHQHRTLLEQIEQVPIGREKLKHHPVFLTIDLDVLDPSVLPGTGTPEPGGMQFTELMSWLMAFKGLNFVGADVIELAPDYDASGVSTAVATKVLREVLLLL